MVGDAQHRHVPKRVKIVLCESSLPRRLDKWEQRAIVPEVADEPAPIGVRIVDLTDVLDDAPVVEPESCRVRNKLDIREAVYDTVVGRAHQVE
jgi:hypothetical protein